MNNYEKALFARREKLKAKIAEIEEVLKGKHQYAIKVIGERKSIGIGQGYAAMALSETMRGYLEQLSIHEDYMRGMGLLDEPEGDDMMG